MSRSNPQQSLTKKLMLHGRTVEKYDSIYTKIPKCISEGWNHLLAFYEHKKMLQNSV